MKNLFRFVNILIFSLFFFSGCNVTDKINEEILDIQPNEDNANSSSVNKKSDETNGSKNKPSDILEGNTSIITGGTNCDTGTHYDTETEKCELDSNSSNINSNMCGIGTHLENSKCVVNSDDYTNTVCQTGFTLISGQCVSDNLEVVAIDEFNLSILESKKEDRKSIDITMGKNDKRTITIRSNPKQTDVTNKIEFTQLTNNNVVTPYLFLDGAPRVDKDFDFTFKVTSKELIGKDEFQLTLRNTQGFTDSVFVNVEIVDQISLSGVRKTYTTVTEGEPINIVIKATNIFNNPLKFAIIDKDIIRSEGKLILTQSGLSTFLSNTKDGIEFKFSVKGLKDDKRDIEITVSDTTTGTVKSIYLTIESVRRNTRFYADLYECGEAYNKNYEITNDINTPEDQDGLYSADNTIFLKSLVQMDYDIANKFSKVIVFHPTNGDQYTYGSYGKEYITNLDTGRIIAVVYFAKHLQGLKYYVKYYNEDKNTVVCEKRRFGYIDAITEQPNVLENLNIPNLTDKPNGPDGL